jgi:hypothetical protein
VRSAGNYRSGAREATKLSFLHQWSLPRFPDTRSGPRRPPFRDRLVVGVKQPGARPETFFFNYGRPAVGARRARDEAQEVGPILAADEAQAVRKPDCLQMAEQHPGGRCHRPAFGVGLRRSRTAQSIMARPGHRAGTHGGWQKHQPEPGYFAHRSPNGYVWLVTNQGTLALGRTAFSAGVWEASKPKLGAVSA